MSKRFFKALVAYAQVPSCGQLYRKMIEVEAAKSGVPGIICVASAGEPGSHEQWTLAHERSGRTILRGLFTPDLAEAQRVARRLKNLYRWDVPEDQIISKINWEQIAELLDKSKWKQG